jgi:microcystin degradation protein MlrC
LGRAVEVELGGKLAPAWYDPLPVRGTVQSRHATVLGGRSVVLRCDQVDLVVTENAPVCLSPRFYREVGLSPWKADVCVVKSWVAFRFHWLPQNRLSLWGRTRGVTDLDAMRAISYDVPVHPFAEIADWRDADRRRRRDTAAPIRRLDPVG